MPVSVLYFRSNNLFCSFTGEKEFHNVSYPEFQPYLIYIIQMMRFGDLELLLEWLKLLGMLGWGRYILHIWDGYKSLKDLKKIMCFRLVLFLGIPI